VIQQSQASVSAAAEDAKANRGTGKPSLPAPVVEGKSSKSKGKNKDNIIGRGKESKFPCSFPPSISIEYLALQVQSTKTTSST